MTTKTDITQERAAFETWHERLYGRRPVRKGGGYAATAHTDRWTIWLACRAAVEADRQDHVRDATKMVPSDEEIEACGSGGPMSLVVALDFADNPRPYGSLAAPADTNGELYKALRVLAAEYRALLSRYSSGQPAASAEPRPDEYDYFVDWYDKEAPYESEVSNFDMARHAWLAGVHFADLFPAAAPVAQEPVAWACNPYTVKHTHSLDLLWTKEGERAIESGVISNGTKLYAAPVAAQAQPTMPALTDAMRAVLRTEHDVYLTEDALYAALCDAAGAQPSGISGELPSAQDREDAERLDWLDGVAHCADWLDGEPTKRVIRASDGAEFTGDTWREAIDAARAAKGDNT